jgi:hypothetical protein
MVAIAAQQDRVRDPVVHRVAVDVVDLRPHVGPAAIATATPVGREYAPAEVRAGNAEDPAGIAIDPADCPGGGRSRASLPGLSVPGRRRPGVRPSPHGQRPRPLGSRPAVQEGAPQGAGPRGQIQRSPAQLRHPDGRRWRIHADYQESEHEGEMAEVAFRGPTRGPNLSEAEVTEGDLARLDEAESDRAEPAPQG